MYTDKEKLSTLLHETIDDLILGDNNDAAPVSIDNLLNPKQKFYLVQAILNALPKTDHEKVIEFNETFKVDKEVGYDVTTFKSAELRFRLLLEEVLELGAALGIPSGKCYQIYVELQDKVIKKDIEIGIVEVLDALTDITYVNYGALHVFNLDDITHDAMENVHDSNMSKIVSKEINQDAFIRICDELRQDGTNLVSEEVERGIVIRNKDTGKVLKPSTYIPATLGNLMKTYLKAKSETEEL